MAAEGNQLGSSKIVEMEDNLFDIDNSSDNKGADENSDVVLQTPVHKKVKMEPSLL
ncbi:hypothetical protein HDU81_005721, partial [Chytriomyces hyalinus]